MDQQVLMKLPKIQITIKILNLKQKNHKDNNCYKKLNNCNKNVRICKWLKKLLKDIWDFKCKHWKERLKF